MAYVALYRKFRPETFDEVKGQDAIVTTLKNQMKHDRLGHAYLFCGTRGTGKTSVAKILAKAVNCESPVDGSPCGECASCKRIAEGSDVNVIEIDAASNNGVDNVRQIREGVQYPPVNAKKTVYIIDEVHMLSMPAFNALLKTLEEPPSYVLFILATTELHKVPVTIRSRCQILTLTDNVCRYDMETFAAMPDILMRLTFEAKDDLVAGEDCAAGLIEVLGSLGDMASETVQARWADRLKSAENLESAAMKLLEKRIEGETGCEYLRLREEFLSILHAWFAQIALVAEGTPRELLSNPEVVRVWLDASPRPEITPDEAARMLSEAENLVRVLNTNVSDELAVRAFALSVAIDTQARG